jgi:hypothetical protein
VAAFSIKADPEPVTLWLDPHDQGIAQQLLVGAHDDGPLHSPDPVSEPSAHGSI